MIVTLLFAICVDMKRRQRYRLRLCTKIKIRMHRWKCFYNIRCARFKINLCHWGVGHFDFCVSVRAIYWIQILISWNPPPILCSHWLLPSPSEKWKNRFWRPSFRSVFLPPRCLIIPSRLRAIHLLFCTKWMTNLFPSNLICYFFP